MKRFFKRWETIMLDLKFVRSNLEDIKKMIQNRGYDLDVSHFEALDEKRREQLSVLEALRHNRNTVSDRIATMKKDGQDASNLIAEMKTVSAQIKEKEKEVPEVEEKLKELLQLIPNFPDPSVPVGKDEKDNPVIRTWGDIRDFPFEPLPHWEIGENLGILDFACAAKLSGARFALYRGAGAALERALINFMLHIHTTEHGYTEILPPFMVNAASMFGTGQLPKFEEDLFKVKGRDLYLIPTAEVPVTNMYREEVLQEDDLPATYVAYTPCFRSEAGSYGKDTRGLIRQHQFNKVELVKFFKTGGFLPKNLKTDPKCRGNFETASIALSGGDTLHGRYRFFSGKNLRSRGVVARAGIVPGNIFMQ